MVQSVATEKIPSVTQPGIDPETVRLVAQCLNHYATPGPTMGCNARKTNNKQICKMSTVYRSVFDSERNFAFNKSVAGHDETNIRMSDKLRA
jgi:hypothetical protein